MLRVRMLGLLGALLGWFVGSVLRVRRAHVLSAMRGAGIGDPERTANAMYGSLGRSLCELLFGALDRRARGDRVTFDTALFEALDSRGAVIATAHTGNWDLVACEAAARVRLSVVTKHLSLRMLDRFWQSLRAKRGVRLLSAGQAARGALAALGRGEVVAMLIDQAPERERATIVAPFLGQLARVDLAPALAALRARVPLIVAFSRRCPNGRQACQLLTVIQPPTRPNRGWAEQAMRRATAELDAFVRLYPEQWLWMHRRWKDAPSRLEAPSSSRARVAQSPMGSA